MMKRSAEKLGNLPGILFHMGVASRPAHAKIALRCSGWCCKKSVRSYTTSLICEDTLAALKPRRKMSPETYLFYTFYIHICPWKQNYLAVLGRNFQNDFTTPGPAKQSILTNCHSNILTFTATQSPAQSGINAKHVKTLLISSLTGRYY